jgi:hypothetical protein
MAQTNSKSRNGKAPDTASPPEESQVAEQVDAVIIRVIRQENGSIIPVISTNGDVRITEIETILRVARESFLDTSRK